MLAKLLLFAVLLEFLVGCAGLDRLAVGQTDRLKGAPFYKTAEMEGGSSQPN